MSVISMSWKRPTVFSAMCDIFKKEVSFGQRVHPSFQKRFWFGKKRFANLEDPLLSFSALRDFSGQKNFSAILKIGFLIFRDKVEASLEGVRSFHPKIISPHITSPHIHFTPRSFHPIFISPHIHFTPQSFHPTIISPHVHFTSFSLHTIL